MERYGYISGRDPGDESEAITPTDPALTGPWEPGFPGVPRGTSQPHLNIPPFTVACRRCSDNGCCHCQGD